MFHSVTKTPPTQLLTKCPRVPYIFSGKVATTACDSREAVSVLSQRFFHHAGTGVRSVCLSSSLPYSVGFLFISEKKVDATHHADVTNLRICLQVVQQPHLLDACRDHMADFVFVQA